ncbi:MAG TPA: hypothetical protein VM911_12810 [Pyrinomonadaceae bacterium]|jgi:hypothetical protein|nr:hypothetical protein [Pyrinomonadaceae bacterium]
MSDDYLWDRSGEPDPEIVKLEKALGRLRHQPKTIALPIPVQTRRPFFPAMAAAAVILMVLAGGLWLALRRSINEERISPRVVIASPVPGLLAKTKPPAIPDATNQAEANQAPALTTPAQGMRSEARRRASAGTRDAVVAKGVRPRQSDAETLREGEEATEKLMMALRFASSKLNLVQKKMQVNRDGAPAS